MPECAHGRTAERCGACEEEAWAGALAGSIAAGGTHFFASDAECSEDDDGRIVLTIYPADEATARRVFAAALAAVKEGT